MGMTPSQYRKNGNGKAPVIPDTVGDEEGKEPDTTTE